MGTVAQWAGGLGAPVALGTPMAMVEWPRSGWASYHSRNTNNCQDLGNSILLLLGLIICINIGINMATLVRAGLGGRVLAGWLGGRPGIGAGLGSLCPSPQLWHKLRGFLHRMFCRIVCEKGKWSLSVGT